MRASYPDELRRVWQERLKTRRLQCGFTQEELGKKIDVPKMTVWRWENYGHMPSTARLASVAAALRTTTDTLRGLR